jgi:opacity protein-like surface antigen
MTALGESMPRILLRHLLTIFIAVMLSSPFFAQAESEPFVYIGALGAPVYTSSSDGIVTRWGQEVNFSIGHNTGFMGSTVFGLGIGEVGTDYTYFRFELEGNYQYQAISSLSILGKTFTGSGYNQVFTFGPNLYVYFPLGKMSGYGMAGVGAGSGKYGNDSSNIVGSYFNSNLGTGITYPVNKHVSIDGGYRYTFSRGSYDNNVIIDNLNHKAVLGIRYRF